MPEFARGTELQEYLISAWQKDTSVSTVVRWIRDKPAFDRDTICDQLQAIVITTKSGSGKQARGINALAQQALDIVLVAPPKALIPSEKPDIAEDPFTMGFKPAYKHAKGLPGVKESLAKMGEGTVATIERLCSKQRAQTKHTQHVINNALSHAISKQGE